MAKRFLTVFGLVMAFFVPTEIKLPVLNTILRSGWDVSCGLW
jgi:hypothetical protein